MVKQLARFLLPLGMVTGIVGCSSATAHACQKCDVGGCYETTIGFRRCTQAGEHCLAFGGPCNEEPCCLGDAAKELADWKARLNVSDAEIQAPFSKKASAQMEQQRSIEKKLGRAPAVAELPVVSIDLVHAPQDAKAYGEIFWSKVFPVLRDQCLSAVSQSGPGAAEYVVVFELTIAATKYEVRSARVAASNMASPDFATCVAEAYRGMSWPKTSAETQPALLRAAEQGYFKLRGKAP